MKNWVDKREISDKTDNLVALFYSSQFSYEKFHSIQTTVILIQMLHECASEPFNIGFAFKFMQIFYTDSSRKFATFDHSQKYFY